ncbi:kielin/chordin-like protein [Conger conger]|uniref:kielin/chordin-like protein n=1 Tax=Conger conger TaxID=82655 RepID=UPI002A59DB66|nr:kielin/chordin-like protein [Conger conger]
MGSPRIRTALSLQFCVLAFWNFHLATRAQEDGPLQYYDDENVIDLLEALNITRSIKGVTKAKGMEPGIPAWKFRQRVPHLTLPRDFSIYFLSTMQGSIGFHFVAQQAKNSDGALISFISPAALKKDGHPLLQLVSSTRSNQLRLDYRAVHSMEPASILFPGGTPFSNDRWARVALNLEPHKISLFIDCEEAIVFEKTRSEDVLSLTLPIDLEITFASVPGDKASKFMGYWQTAEVSTSGYIRRPWHCENLSDSMPHSLPSTEMEDPYGKDPSVHLEPQSDSAHDQPQRTHLGPPGSQRGSKPLNPEERIRRLEELVDGLSTMLDMVKAQNTDLVSRVQYLETCECRRPTCTWEEREVEEGARWETDQGSTCECVTGKVQCAVSDGCVFEGKTYSNGDVFSPDPCESCVCENGRAKCQRGRCHPLSCLNQYIPEGECCPICQPGCEYEEEVYENGAVFVSRSNPCQKCTCTNSLVKCTPVQCQPTRCSRPFQIPGQCCPTCSACDVDGRPYNGSFNTLDGCQICTCRKGDTSCVDVQTCQHSCSHGVKPPYGSCCQDCSRCSMDGQIILDGASFSDRQDPCKRCVCMNGNLVCTAVSCPPLDCVAAETSEGECCPMCRGCVHNGIQREHGLQWRMPDNPCTICTCVEGQVQCQAEKCAPSCKNPSSPPPGTCCPVCKGCGMNGRDYLNGEQVPGADRCQECTCFNGDLKCSPTSCPHALCRNPVTRPGECCPRCEQCDYESQVYVDGQVFVSRLDPCSRCQCSGGEVSCERLDHTCPPLQCTHPAQTKSQCCPTCEMCEYERKVYTNGKRFNPPGSGPCVHCTCMNGNVRCHQEKCPLIQCSNPVIDPQLCCPVCKVCVVDGLEFEEGEEWDAEGQPCRRCRCVGGEPVCHVTRCPAVSCLHPSKLEGQCCATCDLCSYNQRIYSNGQDFHDPDDPCQQCRCQDGTVKCTVAQCPPPTCSSPQTPPGQCCPQCPNCDFDNRVFVDGEEFPSPVNPCQECVCSGGRVDCQDQECPHPTCTYPLSGSCCRNNCNGCNYAGKEYPNGMEFPHPTDRCRTCHCINGNVQCLMKRCPPQQCSNPSMVPGECCPQCPAPPADCLYKGQSYKHSERFYDPADKCRTCICTNGSVSCQRRPCSHAHCTHPILQDCCRTCDGCLYDGKEHANGETFADRSDPCGMCVCRQGTVTCERKHCPAVTCPFPVQTQCCQICDGCSYVGEEYLNGEEFTDPRSKCKRCSCAGGHVTCSPKPCYTASCSHPVTRPGSCCPVCEGCLYNGVAVTDGQSFPDPKDSECSECTCRAGTVHCIRRICSPAPCSHPAPGPCDCPVCEGCVFQDRSYVDGDVFSGPKGTCQDCKCMDGEVTCGSKQCPKVTCTHPAKDICTCPVCEGCHFNGRDCNNGEHFTDPKNKCQRCTCLNGGVTCVPVACSPTSCRNPITPLGQCCPVCTGRCKHKGQVYESGATFDSPSDRCRSCTCLNEAVTCHRKPCPQQCSHPVPSGGCCPACDGCLYEGVQYTSTQTFTPAANPCQRCSCVRGSVACTPQVCPPTPCLNPVTPPNQCCAKCPAVCFHQGQEYADGLRWVPSANRCQECTCVRGDVRCSEVVCNPPCSHPSPSPLGQCCPQCQDCFLEGVLYGDGDDFTLDGCRQCSCSGGNILCSNIECPKLTCMHQVTEPGTCCPRCRGCTYDGREHTEGSTWFASSTPCMSCMCVDGVTTCSEVRCVSPCLNHIQVPGECCAVCADCVYNGQVYAPGDSFHPSNDPCQICTCEVMPDGEQHLHCYRKQCPSLVDCPKNHILFSGPDSCCPVCAQPLSNCTATLIGNEVHATDDPCFTCQCKDLTWTCVHQGCLPLSCPVSEQFTPEDSCCPTCNECVIEGGIQRLANGESWTDPLDECITCTCNLGYIECNIQECEPLVCQDGLVKVKSPGQCCYECQDPSVSCVYQGTIYQSNEHWEVDECTSCTCVSGDVHCQTERCPLVTCASDETPALIPGMCCPHCIPRPATCIVFGDPHYRTFDGKMINFQGACTYVLAEDCEGGDFSIHVMNDDRGRKGVSWTKEVTIFIGDVMVQLLQNWMVMVDYQTVTLPYLKEPYIYVERKTNTILLNTNIGVKVLWNGKSHLEVSVPGTYKNHMCGLCGNFNNYPQDDMRLPTGQAVKSEATFGNSWKVKRDNDTASQCRDGEDIDPCKEAGYFARKMGNVRCAILKSEVFERCHKVIPPEMFYASCVYDLCACGANSDDCLCDALEAYASECREAGVVLQWRTHALCAVGCPLDRGFVFDECGPPCPKTCFNKDVPLGVIESHCFKPCVPGCQCPAGLVEHESHCISPETCPKIIYGNS